MAAVSSREIDGNVLTLSASGWTYGTRFVLYDYQTWSMWFCMDSSCSYTGITGSYSDRQLTAVHSEKTTWNQWKNSHPDSKYMLY
ncbi:MAG: DUF3179 domain-containing protein [Candidatus Latescibacteria bacterium]|nr:DUF3179 domain-containing protein [bacterium]MBD3425525.1 DUF3179 domain-containing protein [Candidatus Latescibacterota bacterium]